MVFEEKGKPEYPEKNLSARSKEKNQRQTQPMFGTLDQGYSLFPPFLFITSLDVSMVSISFGIWSVFMLCLKGALLSFSSSKSLLLFSVSE